jgi:glycosyltransferase involved in cell wall biosynthesis
MLDTAVREWTRARLGEIGWADVVVGIPAFNSERTIAHVMKAASEGLSRHFPGKAHLLIVSDGGSTDYTREVAQKTKLAKGVQKIVTIYRGVPGKGTSLRCVFESALLLEAKACAVLDSDLRSVTPDWMKAILTPVLEGGFDFVSPYYVRHKNDGTITNNIARVLTQALYGRRLRQPIGGDFGLSPRLMTALCREDVWETDVAKFGVDIWMTTVAVCEGFKVCEAYLGSKLHDPKDPAASLAPMFRQVVGTLFEMMRRYERVWKSVRRAEDVPLLGEPRDAEPEPVEISLDALARRFREGLGHFGPVWKEVLEPATFEAVAALAGAPPEAISFPGDLWARVVYDFAAAYPRWRGDRGPLLDMLVPIYFARVAGFVNQTRSLGPAEAEGVVDDLAGTFERLKPHLEARWEPA